MASEKRQSDSAIIERLFEEYYRFSFFKAVNLLETLHPGKVPIGEAFTPDREAVRFSVNPGFEFPPSDIDGLSSGEGDGPPEMNVAFLGLIGPSGELPHWYNQLAIERRRNKDRSMARFFDIFHHRLISMFYLAWKKYRFPENYRYGARDRLSGYLLSLIGLGTPGLTERIGLPEESLTFYTGLLSRSVASAVTIEATVGFLAGTAVRVDQFIDRMLPLSEADRTRVGMANGRLGEDAVCGSYVWESQTKFRVNLGPMGYADFLRFLPSGDLLAPIFALVRYMVGIEYEFEIRVYLNREEVPVCTLGGEDTGAGRLGWASWSKHTDFMHDDHPYVTFQRPTPVN